MIDLTDEKRKIFAERLKQASVAKFGKERGVATFLADELDVSVSTAAKYLSGKVIPAPHRWGEIAVKLSVTTSWLVGASHETPKAISDKFDDKSLDFVGKAAKVVFPLVMRLKPEASKDEITELTQMAFQRLKAGDQENTVAGDVAATLLKK